MFKNSGYHDEEYIGCKCTLNHSCNCRTTQSSTIYEEAQLHLCGEQLLIHMKNIFFESLLLGVSVVSISRILMVMEKGYNL